MNESKIKNINTAGKVGYIITVFLLIIAISAFVTTAIATAASIALSNQQVDVKLHTSIDVTSDGNIFKTLNKFLSVDGIEDLNDLAALDGQTIELEDSDLSEVTVSKINNGYAVDLKTNEVSLTTKTLIGNLVVTLLFIGCIICSLYMFRTLMKELKVCETPFSENVIKRMTNFAYSLIPTAVLSMLNDSFWQSLNSTNPFNFNLNLGTILLVAVVFVLILIFKYGAQLQQESDETL